jgi:type I restriction enzyme S subunit
MASLKDMRYNHFDFSDCKTISKVDFDFLIKNNCSPKHGDIIISKDGANCLELIFVYKQTEEIVLLSSIAIARLKKDFDPDFYRYFLLSPNTQQMMRSNFVSGSAIPRVILKDFKNVPIPIIDYSEQIEIAEILKSLDDKIDLLYRQNKTLEQLSDTLFRQWFVEEAMGDNIKLGEVVKTSSGGTPSRSKMEYYSNGTIKWVKSKELQGSFIFETEENITDEALNNSSAKLFPTNTILIAMYGATVGEYGILAEPATCNQAICALIPNENYPYTFLFVLTKFNKENLINMAGGSAQQNISQELIQELEIPKSKDRIKEFHMESEPMFQKIKSNTNQIHTLTQIRDALLPKLMSGEIRVEN